MQLLHARTHARTHACTYARTHAYTSDSLPQGHLGFKVYGLCTPPFWVLLGLGVGFRV
jgi:hypothetical protein